LPVSPGLISTQQRYKGSALTIS